MSDRYVPAWTHPIVLGSRLCWCDGERNVTIPIIEAKSIYTDERRHDLENGWNARLPTENGATVDLTYDPDSTQPGEAVVTQWLYVEHPQFGYLIEACVRHDHIVYDPTCDGEKCAGCRWCMGTPNNQWHEFVRTPQEVMANLAYLGSLPIKVVAA